MGNIGNIVCDHVKSLVLCLNEFFCLFFFGASKCRNVNGFLCNFTWNLFCLNLMLVHSLVLTKVRDALCLRVIVLSCTRSGGQLKEENLLKMFRSGSTATGNDFFCVFRFSSHHVLWEVVFYILHKEMAQRSVTHSAQREFMENVYILCGQVL